MDTNKVKLYLGIALVFFLGVIVGVAGTKLYREQMPRHGDHLAERKMELMKKLDAELQLSQQQKPEIQAILDKSFEEMRALREKHKPEMDKVMEDGIVQMKEKLDNEQKQKLDKLHEKFLERRKQREKS